MDMSTGKAVFIDGILQMPHDHLHSVHTSRTSALKDAANEVGVFARAAEDSAKVLEDETKVLETSAEGLCIRVDVHLGNKVLSCQFCGTTDPNRVGTINEGTPYEETLCSDCLMSDGPMEKPDYS